MAKDIKQIIEHPKAENIYVVPADFQWNDIGSWKALYDVFNSDKKGNIISSAEPTEYQLKINEKLETTDLIFRN